MRKSLTAGLTACLGVAIGGCLLVTAQLTIVQSVDVGVTTSATINSFTVDLNKEEDYRDHKDEIKSVDAISLVARIKNNASNRARAEIYISDDPTLDAVDRIQREAALVFVSPEVGANDSVFVNWNDSFRYIRNRDILVDQILNDGVFTVYGIAENVPFDLEILAEIVVTLTVGQ